MLRVEQIRPQCHPGARLFVLTLLIPEGGRAHPAKTADIGMMALFGGGRERTETELRRAASVSAAARPSATWARWRSRSNSVSCMVGVPGRDGSSLPQGIADR
jgi:hypothetical protein